MSSIIDQLVAKQHVSRITQELLDVAKQTPGTLMTADDVCSRVNAYLEEASQVRGVGTSYDSDSGIVLDFLIEDTRRGCTVHGLDDNGVSITAVKLRSRRSAKKVGRSLINSMFLSFTVAPIIPLKTVSFKSVV